MGIKHLKLLFKADRVTFSDTPDRSWFYRIEVGSRIIFIDIYYDEDLAVSSVYDNDSKQGESCIFKQFGTTSKVINNLLNLTQ